MSTSTPVATAEEPRQDGPSFEAKVRAIRILLEAGVEQDEDEEGEAA